VSDSLHFRQLHEAMEAHRKTNAKLRDRVSELEVALRDVLEAAEDGRGHNPKGKTPGECAGCNAVLAARKALEVEP